MRVTLQLLVLASGVLLAACSSKSLNDDGGGAGAPSDDTGDTPRACSAALMQSLSLVDQVASAPVATLSESADDRTIYVDATAGGINGQDQFPWVYVSLASGQAVGVTDLQALSEKSWDLAFKRFLVRTNSGDSGPGKGGAIRIALAWDSVSRATLGDKALPVEAWFDADCMLKTDVNSELITTFTGWSAYDEATHVLNAANVVYITAAADGTLYKVAIEDYYSTSSGKHGTVGGHYKVRIAPLP